MSTTINKLEIQQAYRKFLSPYADQFQYAVTLTLKQSIRVAGKDGYYHTIKLDQEKLQKDIHFFNARLTRYLYGNACKREYNRDFAKPLVIIALEGGDNLKNLHLHIGLGNVPENKKSDIHEIIGNAWSKCDFANTQMEVTPIYDGQGWIAYMTKEIWREKNDVIDVFSCSIPKSLMPTTVTEGLL
jgi:hypothetical protein